MSACTFFGHREPTGMTERKIICAITKVIVEENADLFYVGNNGHFDSIVVSSLKKLESDFSHIKGYIVLSSLPSESEKYNNTLFPEGLEKVPKKFCIDKRNMWMIDHSDIVITHVIRPFGGAAKFKRKAEAKGKKVYNIV